MIVNNSGITTEGSIQGKVVNMTVDLDAMGHIMGVLTNLYSDAEYACIREIATNARDSHIAAGIGRPIEVSLPHDLSPFLRIRDYGLGLYEDDIVEIYSRYGASTKRDSNEFVGMLGLGCKSPLAYTSQFTLVGVKDGIKTTVIISRSDTGGGNMTVLDPIETDEPNGVEVSIPAKKENSMADKAADFFRFWEPGTVLVDGKEPARIEGLKISDDMMIVLDGKLDHDVIVMGDVPYPVSEYKAIASLNQNAHVVAWVPIGSVDFVPAREALEYDSAATIDALKTIRQYYSDNVERAISETIADAATHVEAFKIAYKWRDILGKRRLRVQYKNLVMPDDLTCGENSRFVISRAQSNKWSEHDRKRVVSPQATIYGLFIYGYENVTFTPSHKKKLEKYVEDHPTLTFDDIKHFILHKDKPDTTWIDSSRLVSWEVIKEIKLPQAERKYAARASRPKGSYDTYVAGRSMGPTDAGDIDTTKQICFVNTTQHGKDKPWEIGQMLSACGYEGTLVAMASNRIDKFQRDFPKAKDFVKVLRRYFNAALKKITEEDHRIADFNNSNSYEYMAVRHLDVNDIDDPDVVEYIEMFDREPSKAYNTVFDTFGCSGWRILGLDRADWPKMLAFDDEDIQNPLDKYPLYEYRSYDWRSPSQEQLDHLYIYMNAVYHASQEDN